jgi:hypothetical protein
MLGFRESIAINQVGNFLGKLADIRAKYGNYPADQLHTPHPSRKRNVDAGPFTTDGQNCPSVKLTPVYRWTYDNELRKETELQHQTQQRGKGKSWQ